VTKNVANLYQSSMMTFPETCVTSWITTYYCKIAGKAIHNKTHQYADWFHTYK